MSADDYIFVAKMPDGTYRVKHVVGAYWESHEEAIEEMKKGSVYSRRESALLAAHNLYRRESEMYPVEYGVREIDLSVEGVGI